MRQVGAFSGSVLRKAGVRRGFAEVEILAQWHKIVPSYGVFTRPVKLWQGKLTVATNSSSASMNLNMQKPLIISRINQFLGYVGVDDIRFVVQAFDVKVEEKHQPITPNEGAKGRAEARCADVADEELRASLTRLGAMVEMENIEKFLKKK